jgi:hypothetical protein
MKTILALSALLTFGSAPAFAWGDVCSSSQKKFHKEYSIMTMCKRDGGCSSYLHAVEAKKALQRGQDAGCPWAFQ